MEMKTGDILATWHPFEFNKVGLGMAGIRKLTKGPEHVAMILVEGDTISVIEASYTFNSVIKCSLDTWMTLHKGAEVEVFRPILQPNEAILSDMAKAQLDKEYDISTVLWHHVYYQLMLKCNKDFKWQGPTENGKAADKFYCSELIAYIYDLEQWWNITPKQLIDNQLFETTNVIFHA